MLQEAYCVATKGQEHIPLEDIFLISGVEWGQKPVAQR